jgi:hypothetical protein
VDADELWVAADPARTLADVLAAAGPAVALQVELEDFPPPRDLRRFSAGDLPRFAYRFAASDGRLADADPAPLAAGEHSFLPHTDRTKVVVRADPEIVIDAGGHSASGLPPGPVERSTAVRVLHVPLRDEHDLRAKQGHGRRLREAGFGALHGWQQQMLLGVESDEQWNRLWRANSVGPDGALPSGRPCDALVEDDALARLAPRLAAPVPPPGPPPPRLLREHGLDVARRQRGGERRGVEAAHRLAETSRMLQEAREKLSSVTAELHRARAAAEAYQAGRAAEVGALRTELGRREREIDAVRASVSWRLTRPLRAFTRGRWEQPPGPADDTSWADPLVDPGWYLATYPDVAASGQDAAEHYARWGQAEGRLPRPPEPV